MGLIVHFEPKDTWYERALDLYCKAEDWNYYHSKKVVDCTIEFYDCREDAQFENFTDQSDDKKFYTCWYSPVKMTQRFFIDIDTFEKTLGEKCTFDNFTIQIYTYMKRYFAEKGIKTEDVFEHENTTETDKKDTTEEGGLSTEEDSETADSWQVEPAHPFQKVSETKTDTKTETADSKSDCECDYEKSAEEDVEHGSCETDTPVADVKEGVMAPAADANSIQNTKTYWRVW